MTDGREGAVLSANWKVVVVATVMALGSMTACAPITNAVRKTTNSFAECMAMGGVGSAVLGLAIGVVAGSGEAGIVAGLAGMLATWATCAESWKQVESSSVGNRDQALAKTRRRPVAPLEVTIEHFSISASKPGEDLVVDSGYVVLSNDADRKDIQLKTTWKFWIPATTADNKVIYPALQTVNFANDVTAQQGKRMDGGKLPTPAQIPGNPPWYVMYSVEGDGLVCVASMAKVAFAGERSKGAVSSQGFSVPCDATPDSIPKSGPPLPQPVRKIKAKPPTERK
ncbi:MAG: hypothetical protein V5B34_08180 [Accumulibacter sp.]|jgi:hypothetical protein